MDEPTKSTDTDKRVSLDSFDETIIHDSQREAQGSFPSISGYRITREIARGGMGKVFEAIDLSLGRTVAIKTILPGMESSRFETESRITAQLPHPSIPPVHALGYLSDGTPFLAMKLIQGVTLASLLKERTSETEDVSRFVQIMEQVAQAVGFAHSQEVVHRDLKPQNIMVGSFGEIQVMDWGLAKKLGNEERYDQASFTAMPENQATMAGTVMGTPGYMSPEQARGELVDCRADVFSIGSMLSTVLTGSPAFVGSSAIETIQLASQGKLEDAMQRLSKPTIAPELRSIASRCLASDPADRYQHGQEVADALAAYRNGIEQRLRLIEVERATELTRRLERKKRMKVLGGAVVGAALLSLVAYFASGHLATMNERATSIAKQKTAQAQADKAAAQMKEQNDLVRSSLMKEIADAVSKTPLMVGAIKEYSERNFTVSPFPGVKAARNKSGRFFVNYESANQNFFIEETINTSSSNTSYNLSSNLHKDSSLFPEEAAEDAIVVQELMFIADRSGEISVTRNIKWFPLVDGKPGTARFAIRGEELPNSNEMMKILADKLRSFCDVFEREIAPNLN